MKKLLCFVIVGFLVMTAGCGKKNDVLPDITQDAQVPDTATENSEIPDISTENINAPDDVQANSYYGSWTVASCLGTASASALSQEEIDQLIGTTITYENHSFSTDGEAIAISGYEEEVETDEVFQEDFGIPFANLGITGSTITAVSVMAEGNFFGSYFFVTENGSLIIYYEGVFFETEAAGV